MSAPVGVEGLLADLETIWHSVSDDKETNAAYQRLKATLAQQASAPVCDHCGGLGDVTGEYPGVACPKCRGTGLAQQPAASESTRFCEAWPGCRNGQHAPICPTQYQQQGGES